jgi:hypothetical protein
MDENKTPAASVAEYVREHAPELDPEEVSTFMAEHEKPEEESGSQLAWAVRVLRQRHEGEAGDGLSVDSVVNEIRRRDGG